MFFGVVRCRHGAGKGCPKLATPDRMGHRRFTPCSTAPKRGWRSRTTSRGPNQLGSKSTGLVCSVISSKLSQANLSLVNGFALIGLFWIMISAIG
ncbi:hypothetical protein H6P81_010022 [Aristolochia fimbriata]|uniref:Uncharacterized protein n=1 Tax=Aristolochia fimbriata TaxID=158543 RepID=A0AAV7EQZ2_ARIFI|nr:hypothetical protein H6P81_010022 [Aristolochia fimbriata]